MRRGFLFKADTLGASCREESENWRGDSEECLSKTEPRVYSPSGFMGLEK